MKQALIIMSAAAALPAIGKLVSAPVVLFAKCQSGAAESVRAGCCRAGAR